MTDLATKAPSFRPPAWLRTALIGRRPKRTLTRIVVLVAAVLLALAYVVLPIHVRGTSMLPTYQDGGVNLVNVE